MVGSFKPGLRSEFNTPGKRLPEVEDRGLRGMELKVGEETGEREMITSKAISTERIMISRMDLESSGFTYRNTKRQIASQVPRKVRIYR